MSAFFFFAKLALRGEDLVGFPQKKSKQDEAI